MRPEQIAELLQRASDDALSTTDRALAKEQLLGPNALVRYGDIGLALYRLAAEDRTMEQRFRKHLPELFDYH
jgi:hypothetical protein